jgi:hypothetical protein
MRKICLAAVFCAGALNLSALAWEILDHPALNTDFQGLWSFAKFSQSQPVTNIYSAGSLAAFQHQLFPAFHSEYVFPYPPDFLLAISWLGYFPFTTAYAVWTIAGLAVLSLAARFLFASTYGWAAAAIILASPACLLNGVGGETGFYSGALLLAGLAALARRPGLAGIAFGVLTLKPQLVVLIPIALLARRDWVAIGSTAATATGLAVASCLVFPPALWPEWLKNLSSFQASELTTPIHLISILTYLCFRNAADRLAAAVLLAGTFLATPHAYVYDTLPLTAAIVILAEYRLSAPFTAIALSIYLAPLLLLTPFSHWFLYAPAEAALFAFILATAWHERRTAASRQTPDQSQPQLQNTY